jgi:hypothetical protein
MFNYVIPKNIIYIYSTTKRNNDILFYRYFNTYEFQNELKRKVFHREFHEELTKMVFNPLRLKKIAKTYNIELMELVDVY